MTRVPEKVQQVAEAIDPDAWSTFAKITTDRVRAVAMKMRREKSVDAALRALEAMLDITNSMAAEMSPAMIERWPVIIEAAMEE